MGNDTPAAALCGLTPEELMTEQQRSGTIGEPPQAVVEHGEDEVLRERERLEDELLQEQESYWPCDGRWGRTPPLHRHATTGGH